MGCPHVCPELHSAGAPCSPRRPISPGKPFKPGSPGSIVELDYVTINKFWVLPQIIPCGPAGPSAPDGPGGPALSNEQCKGHKSIIGKMNLPSGPGCPGGPGGPIMQPVCFLAN